MRLARWLPVVIPLCVLGLALELQRADTAVAQRLRWMSFDLMQRRSPRAYDPTLPVRIVDIDDASLESVGQWPWPRDVLAALVDALAEAGAAVVAFDVVFAEPDRSSPRVWLAERADLPELAPLRSRLERLPDHDERLALAFRGMQTVTGFALTHGAESRMPARKATFAFRTAAPQDDPLPWIPAFRGAVSDLAILEAAAAGNGHFNNQSDLDGVTRRVPLLARVGEQVYPALAIESLRVAAGARTFKVRMAGSGGGEAGFGEGAGLTHVQIPPHFELPTDPHGRMWLHFSPPSPERFVSAAAVLEGRADPARLAGHIVFVGSSAAGLKDLRPTPVDPVAPGVVLHAEVVEQILSGATLSRPGWAFGAELCFTALLGTALVLGLARVRAGWCAVFGAAAAASAVALTAWAFAHAGLLLDPAYPLATVFVVFSTAIFLRFARSEVERRRVRNAFGHYLAPELVEELAADPDKLVLGGEMRDMTLLFCDVRGFTSLSEKLPPEVLTRLMNRFLTPLSDEILSRRGTIDKYMGDCIMAFWNAPLDDPEHARHACAAALAMLDRLEEVNRELAESASREGWMHEPLRIGIGLNSGACCVGNMGSDQRFDYSVISDEVNLASRLEGQSKQYGVDIVIGPATRAGAPEWAALELDWIRVQGKQRPVTIHGLLGPPELAGHEAFLRLERAHEAMLDAYRGRRFEPALVELARCRSLDPGGRLHGYYERMARRCEHFLERPPPEAWDGVFVATEK